MEKTHTLQDDQKSITRKMELEKKKVDSLQLENARTADAQSRRLSEKKNEILKTQQIMVSVNSGEGTPDANILQGLIHTAQQNEFLKRELDAMGLEVGKIKTEQVNLLGNYETTRGQLGEQAQEIEDRDRQIDKIQRDLAKMRISFAGMQSALEGMMPKVEHTLQLTPTYLAGLQEARGDVDRVARNVDITIRQQGDEMRNQMQH